MTYMNDKRPAKDMNKDRKKQAKEETAMAFSNPLGSRTKRNTMKIAIMNPAVRTPEVASLA